MKKLLTACGILFFSFSAFAQPSFGIHANGIMASIKEKNFASLGEGSMDPDDPDFSAIRWKNKSKFSWKIGAAASFPISDNFSFMPQLNLLSKGGKMGYKMDEDFFGTTFKFDINSNITLTYLELPLNIVYNTESFFVGAGPSISYGLNGEYTMKMKYLITDGVDTEEDQMSESEKIKFDNNDEADHPSLKPFEIGANFTAGYKFSNGLFIQGTANIGLNNISPYENTSLKTRYFGIGIGYFFGSGYYVKK